MFAFLGASANIAFVSALILMVLIGIVHAIGLGGDFDADADFDMDGGRRSSRRPLRQRVPRRAPSHPSRRVTRNRNLASVKASYFAGIG